LSFFPSVKPHKVLRALLKAGFYVHHQTGSHVILKHKSDETKRVTLPMHNKDLKIRTLRSILSQAGISNEEFRKII